MVEDKCDAVDINLGCPQNIAKKYITFSPLFLSFPFALLLTNSNFRGYYGAFLMESPELVYELVNILHKYLKIPVFCKMRVFPSDDQTIKFAKMLESAGCQVL